MPEEGKVKETQALSKNTQKYKTKNKKKKKKKKKIDNINSKTDEILIIDDVSLPKKSIVNTENKTSFNNIKIEMEVPEEEVPREEKPVAENEKYQNNKKEKTESFTEEEINHRKRKYFIHFFSRKFINLLNNLNILLADHYHSELIFKGSFVVKWHLLSLGHVEASDKIKTNDVDASIACSIDQHEELLAELLSKGFQIKKRTKKYINLEKKIKDGLVFDLTVNISPSIIFHDPFPITRGKARLVFVNGIPILVLDKDDEFFESFNRACTDLTMTLDLPQKTGMTSYAYRLYKLKRYDGVIDITNLPEVEECLSQVYYETLCINKMNIYFEISDFITHDLLDTQDQNIISKLKLFFDVFLKYLNNSFNVDEVIDFFISCKNLFYCENKKVFKEQIDLMILRCLKTSALSELSDYDTKNEVEYLKLLYLQSIHASAFPQTYYFVPYVSSPELSQKYSLETMQLVYEYRQRALQIASDHQQKMINGCKYYDESEGADLKSGLASADGFQEKISNGNIDRGDYRKKVNGFAGSRYSIFYRELPIQKYQKNFTLVETEQELSLRKKC